MKKFLAVVGIMAGLVFLADKVMAASDLIVRVTPNGFKGLTLSTGVVDFGTLDLGTIDNISGAAVTVTSTGTIVQTYAMHITGTTGWTAGAAAAADQFNLRAVFDDNTPALAAASFVANDNLLTGGYVVSSATVYSVDADGELTDDGNGAAPASVRDLWFKLDMPTTSSFTGAHDITVQIEAQ